MALAAALPYWALIWWSQSPIDPLGYLLSNPGFFLMMAIAYPVVEEIVFRGAIQGYLLRKITRRAPGPISYANAITSIAFAALHGIIWSNPWSLSVFFPSLVYGYFRERTGGLVAPIILHAFYNAGFFFATVP